MSFVQLGGAVPFSVFGGMGKKKKTKKRSLKTKRTTRRKSRKKTSKRRIRGGTILKGECNCDKKSSYKGTEKSPEGNGYCSHCTKVGIIMEGKDGILWKNTKSRWVRL